MVQRNTTGERHTYWCPLFEMKARYFTSIGSFEDAKNLYRTAGVFTPDETRKAIKDIEVEQAYRQH